MLLNKKTMAVINAASTETTRGALQGVNIETDGSAIGCDGHLLVKFTPAMQWDSKEYPTIEGVNPVDNDGELLNSFTLSRDSVTAISKAIPKKTSRYLPVLDNIALDVSATNANGHAVMAVTDLENPQVFKPKKFDGEYPDWRKIIPFEGPAIKVGIAIDKLDKLVRTMKALNVEVIELGVDDACKPLQIKAQTKDGDGSVIALLMPYRLA